VRKSFAFAAAVCLYCAPAMGAEAFITDQTGDEISVLDLASKRVVAEIPVAGKPAGIAIARDGRTAYVTSTEGKFVSLIETVSRNIVAKIAVPDTPLGIAAASGGAFIYVAGSTSRGSIRLTLLRTPLPQV
jgi:YVTN family beta-propeller protein